MLRQLDTELIKTQFNDMNMIFQSSIYLQKLSITSGSMTMFKIKHLLSSMICLTHLSLDVYVVDNNMINGNAWIPLMTRIVIFQFIFKISNDINIDLDSFRTQFWLEEKKWYVTYDQGTDMYLSFLYTNPYFKDYQCPYVYGKKTLIESTGLEPTTYPYAKNLFFNTELSMPEIYLRRMTYADTLIIENNFNNSLEYITSFIDLSRITNFIQRGLETKVLNNKFVEILYNLPHLRSLGLYFSTLISLFDRHWPRIINLNMNFDPDDQIESLSSKQIDALWFSFTQLEQLSFDCRSVRNLSKLFNTMTMTLSNICICHYGYRNNLNRQMVTRQWLEQNTELRHFEYFQNDEKVYIWL
ncbi:unnamed protein product [Rotaria sordida]|uniref:Uncharacterized protein n=1 Tax=Rotaria sordida TaxID=392033 RepID=A0A815K5Q1_9BILA|nr:unnamed protein product [Rotaria sordida]CAF1388420.1 unnamed protein product [Rotaria sordida]CAF3725543.1 unnamed protein product [Rotaria sordida]